MKKKIIRIAALPLFMVLISHGGNAQTHKKTDFSGIWLLDLAKSEFGDVPTYTATKQMKVLQTGKDLKIEFVTSSDTGADSTASETLSLEGKALEITGSDHRKRKITAQLSDDGNTITIRILASEKDDPEAEQFDSNESWTLTTDGKMLIVDKSVKVMDGADYGTKVVYDKK